MNVITKIIYILRQSAKKVGEQVITSKEPLPILYPDPSCLKEEPDEKPIYVISQPKKRFYYRFFF